ncbi:hypothetical protein CVU37_04115 [candidate division BRC1 bacterium HGW-BRC1-1]|jgi:hypothetical protein|nr:MAG: hypothetical protein CVU37_04115 [candidate division BRC1 bacterium HGW-BRC1-1]
MRLKPEKVEYLAGKVTTSLKSLKRIEMVGTAEQVSGAVRRVILEDLRREDELEKEAEAILRQHQQHIMMRALSYSTLLQKTKKELARQKKIVL